MMEFIGLMIGQGAGIVKYDPIQLLNTTEADGFLGLESMIFKLIKIEIYGLLQMARVNYKNFKMIKLRNK